MEELYKLKNQIEIFKREFAWELTFDKEIQAELRAMQDEFYCMAKFFFLDNQAYRLIFFVHGGKKRT